MYIDENWLHNFAVFSAYCPNFEWLAFVFFRTMTGLVDTFSSDLHFKWKIPHETIHSNAPSNHFEIENISE